MLRAFREAQRAAPGFIISCGVLPEVSEAASEHLSDVVRDVGAFLDQPRHMSAVQRSLRHRGASKSDIDQSDRNLTELIGAETTAAYLVGLSVGLALNSLPARFNRARG